MSAKFSEDARKIVFSGLAAALQGGTTEQVKEATRDAVGELSLNCSLKERGQSVVTAALLEIANAYVLEKAKGF